MKDRAKAKKKQPFLYDYEDYKLLLSRINPDRLQRQAVDETTD